MRIAIIPARGGSKRIPSKNIKIFSGKPIIGWSIEVAKLSELFDHIIVSTDDAAIASVAREFGAEVPFIRPPDLSDDHTPTVPVIAHAIGLCVTYGWDLQAVCCIYPAAPLIQSSDLVASLKLFEQSKADYCFPVAKYASPIQRALRRQEDGVMKALYPNSELVRTQDLEDAYYDLGQFYWGSRNAWLSNFNIHSNAIGYQMANSRVIDIDTIDDWKLTEFIFNSRKI